MSDTISAVGNYKQIFNDILELDVNTNGTITVCLASVEKNGARPHFARLKISLKTANEFRSTIKQLQERYQKDGWKKEDLLFPEYASESDPAEYEIEHIDLSLSPYAALKEQLEPLSSLLDIDLFQAEKKTYATLRFYVITFQPDDGDPVHFFRRYTAQKELGHSKWLVWLNDGEYDRISEPLLLFDNEVDCMSRSGMLFIIHKANFQHIFQFLEPVKAVALETLSTIKTQLPIQNFEDFADACERNPAKLRKLNRIATKPQFSKITMSHIKAVLAKQPLPLQIVEESGQEKLVYDAKQPWVILNLLEDNYLWSLMTEQGYEVTSKRAL
jgi:hypothetical protein